MTSSARTSALNRGARVLLETSSDGHRSVRKLHRSQPEAAHRKHIALHRVSEDCEWFRFPEVLGYEPDTGATLLEYFEDHRPLSTMVGELSDAQMGELCSIAGRALAELHRRVDLGEVPSIELEEVLGPGMTLSSGDNDSVPIHGDYGLGNTLIGPAHTRDILLIDPEPAPFLDLPVAARSSPYLDLGMFAGCLEGVFPLSQYRRYSWASVRAFREAFLVGYEEVSRVRISREFVSTVSARLLVLYGRRRGGWVRGLKNTPVRLWLRLRARRLARG